MRVYVELARTAFRQQFAYRAATLAGIFINSIFGIMLASIFLNEAVTGTMIASTLVVVACVAGARRFAR